MRSAARHACVCFFCVHVVVIVASLSQHNTSHPLTGCDIVRLWLWSAFAPGRLVTAVEFAAAAAGDGGSAGNAGEVDAASKVAEFGKRVEDEATAAAMTTLATSS